LARPIVLISYLFRLAGAINSRKVYSPPSSLPSRPYTQPPYMGCINYDFVRATPEKAPKTGPPTLDLWVSPTFEGPVL
jgi:hypothetical protein